MNHPIALALFAYASWGLVPAYWKQLPSFDAKELILWRVLFSAVFLLPILAWRKESSSIVGILCQPRSSMGLLSTSLLIGFNWSLYIWAVTNGHIVESSLGYFLNPLINMLLGTVLLKERLNNRQLAACALATFGVALLTWQAGMLPWISLLLALSFGLYGYLRKTLRLPTVPATTGEALILSAPALLGLFWLYTHGGLHANVATPSEWLWLSASGLVTSLPLLAFAAAAVALPLTAMGFFQFLSPTLQFLLGVFVYGEPFTREQWFSFSFIWLGLALFLLDLALRSGIACRARASRK